MAQTAKDANRRKRSLYVWPAERFDIEASESPQFFAYLEAAQSLQSAARVVHLGEVADEARIDFEVPSDFFRRHQFV